MGSATLHIRLFGTLELRLGGAPLAALGSARAESLLAYLLLHRESPQPRQHIAFRLWPDSTESQARTNLRHVLHDLRRALPDSDRFLEIRTRTIQWKPNAPFWLDVAAFNDALAHGKTIPALRQAVGLYNGQLLEGCYDEWLSADRQALHQMYLSSLSQLAELLSRSGDHTEAIVYAERLLRYQPLGEDVYRLLMQLHAARGDRARALHVYHACLVALDRELGVAPSDATRELYETLLPADREPAPATAAAALPDARPSGPPLVGRSVEWTRLTDLWREVERGQTRFVLVSGEPGVGKSRLVEELRAWCAHRGATTAETRSYAAEGGLAYAPVVAWLRADAFAERVARLDHVRLSELTRLLPELLDRVPDLVPPKLLAESEQRQRLFDAAAAALLPTSRPLLLIADDIQWCDGETLRFIHYLIRAAPRAPLLLIATARREEIDARRPLRELLAGLRAVDRLTEIELSRLGREETGNLARVLTARGLAAPEADALFRETEGNPLFVVEAVRAGWHRGRAGAALLSPRVQGIIESRLDQLSDVARDLIGVAATLGRDFVVDLLAETSDAASDELLRGLDELWRRAIVRELGTGAYDFTHGKIREVAYASLSPARRRHNHFRAAQAFKRLYAGNPVTVSGQIAVHYDGAGVPAEAASWYERAADAALQLNASGEATRLLERGLELVRSLPAAPERDARELAILTSLLAPIANVDGFASTRLHEHHERGLKLARTLGVDSPPELLRSLAIVSLSTDDFESAGAYGEQLRERGHADNNDDLLRVESEYVLGIAAFWQGQLEAARLHFENAAANSGRSADSRRAHLVRYGLDPQAICQSRLANTLWLLGDSAAACRARDAALSLAKDIGHPNTYATVLVFAALLAVEMGDVEALRGYVLALSTRSDEQRAPQTRLAVDLLHAYLRVVDGNAATGIAFLRDTLDDPTSVGHAPGMRAVIARLLLAACEAAGEVRGSLDAAERMLQMGGAARLWESEARRTRDECLARLGPGGETLSGTL